MCASLFLWPSARARGAPAVPLHPERHLLSCFVDVQGLRGSWAPADPRLLLPKVRREYRKFFRANAGKKIYEFTIQRIVSVRSACGSLAPVGQLVNTPAEQGGFYLSPRVQQNCCRESYPGPTGSQ